MCIHASKGRKNDSPAMSPINAPRSHGARQQAATTSAQPGMAMTPHATGAKEHHRARPPATAKTMESHIGLRARGVMTRHLHRESCDPKPSFPRWWVPEDAQGRRNFAHPKMSDVPCAQMRARLHCPRLRLAMRHACEHKRQRQRRPPRPPCGDSSRRGWHPRDQGVSLAHRIRASRARVMP